MTPPWFVLGVFALLILSMVPFWVEEWRHRQAKRRHPAFRSKPLRRCTDCHAAIYDKTAHLKYCAANDMTGPS